MILIINRHNNSQKNNSWSRAELAEASSQGPEVGDDGRLPGRRRPHGAPWEALEKPVSPSVDLCICLSIHLPTLCIYIYIYMAVYRYR